MDYEILWKKNLFRPDEVAELLLLSKRTIYRMLKDGRLTGVYRPKRPVRIPREAILNLFPETPADA